ncbi:hypothetical protein OS493_006709 [Desmophyllum pertusum]|uniref:Ig-like domain-containing protein n=1 Tax=Desmophyllum pertusum TaxID=174260 RepID=A0A9X0D5R8_9CNID|nr:hypothetical protein OS493_006709 [Desmophyllum pertusum]
MKYFLVCSLSLLIIQDVSSATDVMKCEIRSSCFASSGCLHTKPMTVVPGSNITLNCSIVTGGLVQGITWEQAKQRVEKSTGSSDLVLQQSNSTKNSEKMPCLCTNITFTLSWYKDDKLITNGTEGMYHSQDIIWKKGEKTLRSILHLPAGREEQEGFYKCSATNRIPGWSSQKDIMLQIFYECPISKRPTISDPEVLASTFSNASLTCWIDIDGYCPEYLFWYLNDKQLESGEKYAIVEKKTRTKCKNEFILSIFNVTESDEGTYSCHWLCEYEDTTKAAIDLKVYVQPPTISHTGSHREWLLPIIILSAGSVAILFMTFVRFCVKKKWTSSYNVPKHGLEEADEDTLMDRITT